MGRVCIAAVCVLVAGTAWAEVVIDGAVGVGEYGGPLALQAVPTGFGDNLNELDALFARRLPGGELAMALTGNIEPNGNSVVIFLDVRPGGAVAEVRGDGGGVIGSIGGQRTDDWGVDTDGTDEIRPSPGGPSVLDADFNPDVAIEINDNDDYWEDGLHYFVNIIDLTCPNDADQPNKDIFLGSNLVDGDAVTQPYLRDWGGTYAGEITHAFSNANTDGVWGYDFGAPPGDLGEPFSAVTGIELLFSADCLDVALGHVVKVMAFITNGSGEYLSNQFLPGLPGVENLAEPGGTGGDPLFDAMVFEGEQFVTVPTLTGDADGDGMVADDDLSLLLTNWKLVEDWGHGEFSGVPPVDDDDLSLLLTNWTGGGLGGDAIPEPTTLCFLAAAAFWPLARRRRPHR